MGLDKYTRLAELIKQLAPDGGTWITQAKVKEITGETCTVVIGDESQPNSLIELTGVCLRASTSQTTNKLLLTPAVNSVVLLGSLTGEFTDLTIIQVDNIDKLHFKTADFSINASSEGVCVENKGESLKTALNDFISEVQKIVVSIGTTPNVPALEQIKQRINKILM